MEVSPFYRFFRYIHFPLPFRQWERLPRLATHKNEYWDGQVRLTPRPRTCDVFLDLSKNQPATDAAPTPTDISIRPLHEQDWALLPDVFQSAFAHSQPLASWNSHAADRASRCIMNWTRLGRDGPTINSACFIAESAEDGLCGAAITTLVRAGHTRIPWDLASRHPERPEEMVFPHLCWIFVSHWWQRNGIATSLLRHVIDAVRDAGHRALASTVLLDNAPSLLLFWRNGFHVAHDPFSLRKFRVSKKNT